MPKYTSNISALTLPRSLRQSDRVLLEDYSRVIVRSRPLSEARKLALLHRLPSLTSRRRLVSHYLPLVFQLAIQHPKGDFLRKVERGNQALIEFFVQGRCRPWDDVDYMVRGRVERAFDMVD